MHMEYSHEYGHSVMKNDMVKSHPKAPQWKDTPKRNGQ